MDVNYGGGIIISSGDEAAYPGRMKGLFTSEVSTPADFVAKTQLNLQTIASRPIGRDLLDLISKRNQGIGTKLKSDGSGKTVTITNGWGTLTPKKDNTNAAGLDAHAKFVTNKNVHGVSMVMPGQGTSVIINYSVTLDYTVILKLKTPAYIALAHELIHAYHFLSGNMSNDLARDVQLDKLRAVIIEEALTVGAGTYENTRISENAIRREHGLPLREFYNVPGDCHVKGRARAGGR